MQTDFLNITPLRTVLRRPVSYYVKRLQEGTQAFRIGVRGTPLTKSLERWKEQRVVLQVGGIDVPGAMEIYRNILLEHIDAIDAEDDLASHRFQKVGEMWIVQYPVNGTVKQTLLRDHKGLHHYARLLAAPHRAISSIELAGVRTEQGLSILDAEASSSSIERHDDDAIAKYREAFDLLDQQRESAQQDGNVDRVEEIDEQIIQLQKLLWPEGKPTKFAYKSLGRQKEGMCSRRNTIHRSVATAIRRANQTIIDGGLPEAVRFLESFVVAESGNSFAYRPIAPEPEWLL